MEKKRIGTIEALETEIRANYNGDQRNLDTLFAHIMRKGNTDTIFILNKVLENLKYPERNAIGIELDVTD